MPDQALHITPEVLSELADLRSQQKFGEEGMYPGAPNERIRRKSEMSINDLIERLLVGIGKTPSKSYVFAEFMRTLQDFQTEDTEEREQACTYLERIMDVLGIESSDGLLNTWLYGFDPGKERE